MSKLTTHSKNTFGIFIPITIILIAVAVTAAVFFVGTHQYKIKDQELREVQLSVDHSLSQPRPITNMLPYNEVREPVAEIKELPAVVLETVIDKITDTDQVHLKVPFVSQAPFGNWDDPRLDYGCEETSFLMVMHYYNDEPLTKELAEREITELSDWELEHHGEFRDSSAADSVAWFSEYFGIETIELRYDVHVEDIKEQLKRGYPVIVPMDGQILDNPYYTPPGPLHHMLVVVGFDDTTGEFITNDPGTSRGEGMRYSYENFYDALRDYDTGHGLPVSEIRRPMIVIKQ